MKTLLIFIKFPNKRKNTKLELLVVTCQSLCLLGVLNYFRNLKTGDHNTDTRSANKPFSSS